MLLDLPKSIEGNGPTMATIVEIGQILETAKREPPLRFAEIGRRMAAKRVRHATVRASVEFLARLGFVTVGSQGVQWTSMRDTRFWTAARKGSSLLEEA